MNADDERLLWPDWPDFVKTAPERRFIAQGTLINRQSIAQTIGAANLHGPVLAEGVRRVFNFGLEDANYLEHGGRYERSAEPSHRATLNIFHTGNPDDTVNGILFSTPIEDIDALAEREYGYDLLPVDYRTAGATGRAYMFIARRTSRAIGHRVLDDILPNESSLSTCLLGAATYGRSFLQSWIDSCYLADGTPLAAHSYYAELIGRIVDTIEHQEDDAKTTGG